MRIDCAICGSIIIDGERYDYDVVILGNNVSKRQNNSTFMRSEIRSLMAGKPEVIVLGTGHGSVCKVDPRRCR